MTITYPLSITTTKSAIAFRLTARNVIGETISIFTLQSQTIEHDGAGWAIAVDLPPMKPADAEPWIAFLLSLKGKRGTFLIGDPLRTTPRGSAKDTPGTPLSAGVDQTGETINIKASKTVGFKVGQKFKKMV